MRGKDFWHYADNYATGITPAYAGKRRCKAAFCAWFWDHPRMCGEKLAFSAVRVREMGSPPRMRGKGATGRVECFGQGITPAYAGKRRGSCRRMHRIWDHPRVCGEKQCCRFRDSLRSGSPPRMRGKVAMFCCAVGAHRITPAYAGKRLKRSRSTVSPVAIVPLFPSVCNKPVVSDGSPAGRDAPLFLPAENAVPASPAYNLRSL